MAREQDRILRLGMNHRMRSDLDLAFLTRHASLRFDHDLELRAVLRLVTRRISLELVRDNLATHMLFPNEIREAFRLLQIDNVIQALAVVSVRKALRHDRIYLDKREVQPTLLFKKFRHVSLDRDYALQQVVHFPAMLFQTLKMRLVFRIQELLAPTVRHRDMSEQRIVAIVDSREIRHISIDGREIHFFDTPGQLRRHKILEVSARLVNNIVAFYKRRIALRRVIQVRIRRRNRSHFFFTLQVQRSVIAFDIEFQGDRFA